MTRTAGWRRAARLAIAGLLGYLLIAALTATGFNGWLGGADLYGGGFLLQAKGTLVAVVSGLAGGLVAGFIGRPRALLHSLAILPLLLADTIYVLFFFEGAAPFWFDLMGSLTLMASTVAGGTLLGIVARK